MAARSPNGDLPMIAGFIVICRQSTGAPTVTAEPPDDHRRDIGGASAENLVFPEEIDRWPNSLPAAAVRCPLADFTTWFKVKKIGR